MSSYENINNTAHINGAQGPYSGQNSVNFSRNAIHNYYEYLSKLEVNNLDLNNLSPLDEDTFDNKAAKLEKFADLMESTSEELPPLKVNLQYLPGNVNYKTLDKQALMGAAYEELGGQHAVSVDSLNKLGNSAGIGNSGNTPDLNNDGMVDIAEEATTILAADMLSHKPKGIERFLNGLKNIFKRVDSLPAMKIKHIDGKITEQGENSLLAYANPKNKQAAQQDFKIIYNYFNLGKAKDEFIAKN